MFQNRSGNQLTRQALAYIHNYVRVPPGYNEVSNMPLVSLELQKCSAIALSYGTLAGLTHLQPGYVEMPPKGHLEEMLNKMETSGEGVQAIIVPSGFKELLEMRRCCNELKIEIVGYYLGCVLETGSAGRDVIVLPSDNEVAIYTSRKKYEMNFKFRHG